MDNENLEMVNTTQSWGFNVASFKSAILPTAIGISIGALAGVAAFEFLIKPAYRKHKERKEANVDEKQADDKAE